MDAKPDVEGNTVRSFSPSRLTPRGRAARAAVLAAVSATALATAACGTGQVTQTGTQLAVVNGAGGYVDGISLRDAHFVAPQADAASVYGKGGPFQLVFVAAANGDIAPAKVKRIELVDSPSASVKYRKAGTATPATSSETSAPSSATTTSAKPADDPTAGAENAPTADMLLNPGCSLFVGDQTARLTQEAAPTSAASTCPSDTAARPSVVVTNATAVRPGLTTKVKFTFDVGGQDKSVVLDVPVDAGAELTRDAAPLGTQPAEEHGGEHEGEKGGH